MHIQMIILLVLAGVLLLPACAALFFRRTVAATVEGFSWKRSVFLRELPESEWLALDKKATYTLKVTIFGRVTHIMPAAQQVVAAQKSD